MLGNDRMLYRRGASQSATFVVAASDSLHQGYADYVCDGVDDQDTIQAAIDALPSDGGRIILLDGLFNFTGIDWVTDILTITKSNVIIEGQGKATHIKVVGNEGHYVVYFNGVQNCVIRDVWVDGNDLGGYAIQISQSSECKVLNCIAGNTWADGIVTNHTSYSLIKGNIVYDCQTSGHGDCSSGIEIEDGSNYINVEDNYLSDCNNGIWAKRHSGVTLTHDISFVRNILYNSPIVLSSEDTNPIENINVIGNVLLGATTCDIINVSGATKSTIRDNTLHSPAGTYSGINVTISSSYILIDSNRVHSSTTAGIQVSAPNCVISDNYVSDAEVDGIDVYGAGARVINNIVLNSGSAGIVIDASDIIVIGNTIKNSGIVGPKYYGIYALNNDIIISNNIIFDDQDTKTQEYGIKIKNSADTYRVTVVENNLVGNKTSGMYFVSGSNENGIVRNNIGFVTENSGTAALLNGTTSIAVDHGLDVTPSAGDIMVTPTGSLGSASFFYVDTYTDTQFTIHVNANPGVNVDFAWKAIVL